MSVQLEKPVVEIYPESMISNRERPNLLELPWGRPEKAESTVKLPLVFDIKEKAQLHTHSWLMPVIYVYDEQSGSITLRDILPASPHAVYTLESIGGERIQKSARAGVVYVYTRPYSLKLNEKAEGLTIEKLKVGVKLSELRVQVSNVSSFLVEVWKRYSLWDLDAMIDDIKRGFRNQVELMLPQTRIEDVLTRQQKVRNTVRDGVQELLKDFGVSLTDIDLDPEVDDKTYYYYFWHIVNEIPSDYTFLLSLLSSIPEGIQKSVPRAVEIMVAGLLLRSSPSLADYFKTLSGTTSLPQKEQAERG